MNDQELKLVEEFLDEADQHEDPIEDDRIAEALLCPEAGLPRDEEIFYRCEECGGSCTPTIDPRVKR